MRRNATKVAAAVLSLAVTMTSVNIPTSAAAATKKVKLNKKKATLTVGKSTTLKLTQGNKKLKATFTSNKKKIATVGKKTGKVTAKKKGTATITATYKKKKYTCKITVKAKPKPTVKPTAAPTAEPTTAPSTEPTTAPTEAPSTEPTQAPADTVGAITSFKATAADTLTAVLDSAVPTDAIIKITKNDVVQEGDITYNEARTEVTFKGKAELSTGEYVINITKGESKAEAKTTVEDKKVTTINIISKEALTGDSQGRETGCDNKLAYIYYEVLDQYGGDMTSSSDIRWTISSSKLRNVDTSKGKITVESTGDPFVYGTQLYIVGVYASTGATCNTSIPIGMQQAIDKVSVVGFINDRVDKSKIETSLPKNFAPDTWYMVYETFDQNGMPLDTVPYKSRDITFTCDNPLLLESDFNCDDERIYAVGEKQYAAVLVKPGDYADKGGTVNITAISNKTGHREVYSYDIGSNGLLQTLVLGNPAGVVADKDMNVEIPYVAKDTNGTEIKNYETIVRSSNKLSLSASTGTLVVYEKANGEAGIKWSDDTETGLGFDDARTFDDVERIVSLTTVVVGGESTTKMMNIKDRRRPVAFDDIKLNDDDNDALVLGNSASVNLLSDNVTYIDQYGAKMSGSNASTFFNTAFNSFNNEKYVLRAKAAKINDLSLIPGEGTTDNSGNYDKQFTSGDTTIHYDAKDHTAIGEYTGDLEKDKSIGSVAVTYSIATVDPETGVSNRGKTKTITYSVVPQSAVIGNVSIATNSSKYFAATENTINANGTDIKNIKDIALGYGNATTGEAIGLDAGNPYFAVKGTTNTGLTCTLPSTMYRIAPDTEIAIDKDKNKISAVTGGVLRWNELYNENDAKCTRIDAEKELRLNVKATNDEIPSIVSKSIKLSDAGRAPSSIQNFEVSATPKSTIIECGTPSEHTSANYYTYWHVLDQYGIVIEPEFYDMTYSVSDVTEKANKDSEFVHIANSFTVEKNGTSDLRLSGVEIGDKFRLTATASSKANKNVKTSAYVDVTVGADMRAYIANSNGSADADSDEEWRKAPISNYGLGMKR